MLDLIDHPPHFIEICIPAKLLEYFSIKYLELLIGLSRFINLLDTFVEVGGVLCIGARLGNNLDRIQIFLLLFFSVVELIHLFGKWAARL